MHYYHLSIPKISPEDDIAMATVCSMISPWQLYAASVLAVLVTDIQPVVVKTVADVITMVLVSLTITTHEVRLKNRFATTSPTSIV